MCETLSDSAEGGRPVLRALTHIAEMLYIANMRYVYRRRGLL